MRTRVVPALMSGQPGLLGEFQVHERPSLKKQGRWHLGLSAGVEGSQCLSWDLCKEGPCGNSPGTGS